MLALEHRVETYRLTVIRRSNQRRSPKAADLITGKCEGVGERSCSVDIGPCLPRKPALPPVYCCLSGFVPLLLDLKECLL